MRFGFAYVTSGYTCFDLKGQLDPGVLKGTTLESHLQSMAVSWGVHYIADSSVAVLPVLLWESAWVGRCAGSLLDIPATECVQ